jgi:starvation-inducible DNA-binding protein
MATREKASTHLPPLGTHVREQVGEDLQGLLVELIDLSLLGKQLHWSVVGRHFRELHLQLDEFIESWRALADTVAERAVAIGYFPDGQAGVVAKSSRLGPLERGAIADKDVVKELTERLAAVVERARERQERLGEMDAASEDVVIEVIRALEENLWMIRVQSA